MKTLYLDTETTSLVQTRLGHDHPSQPYLVQLGLVLYDDDAERAAVELIIRPDGYTIPDGAAAVHGITTEVAAACGVPLITALATFTQLRGIADELVAYNMPFDDLVMRAAIHRSGKTPSNPGPSRRTCAMTMATPILDRFDKPKPPNLMEAHQFLIGEVFVGAHGALADARACARVHRAILEKEKTR